MQYDITAKVVVERAREAILRRFLRMEPDTIQLIEALPEETVSLKRSDFPLKVTLKNGQEVIVLLEIQTVFSREFLWTLIDYTVRFRLKYRVEVIPLVLLLTPSSLATGEYRDDWLSFRYQVVRLWEVPAREYLDEMALYPFLPLMEGGAEVIEEAEGRIYESRELRGEEKGDLLTAMAIFAGLKDKECAMELMRRRRDLMVQSAAYDLIKQEGVKEGMQQGMQQLLLETLEEKFDTLPLRLVKAIHEIGDPEGLKILHRQVLRCGSLEDFEERMRSVVS